MTTNLNFASHALSKPAVSSDIGSHTLYKMYIDCFNFSTPNKVILVSLYQAHFERDSVFCLERFNCKNEIIKTKLVCQTLRTTNLVTFINFNSWTFVSQTNYEAQKSLKYLQSAVKECVACCERKRKQVCFIKVKCRASESGLIYKQMSFWRGNLPSVVTACRLPVFLCHVFESTYIRY